MENDKKLLIYPILYISPVVVILISFFLLSQMSEVKNVGLGLLLGAIFIGYCDIAILSALGLIFYLANYTLYLKNAYPHKSDNLIINSIFNLAIASYLISFCNYFSILSIFPILNLALNISLIKKKQSTESDAFNVDAKKNKKVFFRYSFLYILFILTIVSGISGINQLVSEFSSHILSALILIFYFINYTLYIKKEYPHTSDSLTINTILNLLIAWYSMLLPNYFSILIILPICNLLLNIKCAFKKISK